MNKRIEELINSLKEKGMKQYEFAKKLGVTEAAVSTWKKGRRNITEQTVKAICREFNVNYDWLMYGEGEMFSDLPKTVLDELCKQYDCDELDRSLIEAYLKLNATERQWIKNYIRNVFLNLRTEEDNS